jgi:hypothetical protein
MTFHNITYFKAVSWVAVSKEQKNYFIFHQKTEKKMLRHS